jgi:GTP-binding protein LepA
MSQSHIRNFAIIAHIDHGKSTLADRLLEMTGTVAMRDMQAQVLDSNPIERERGITIKLAPVRMKYTVRVIARSESSSDVAIRLDNGIASPSGRTRNDKQEYILNLIDTPGHVDFGYEVSRSLAACEGALLVVDSTQGVQAQTLANLQQARVHNLTIIPLINKIDMPQARVEETKEELKALGFREEEMIEISAKTGLNVDKVLEGIVQHIPAPRGNPDAPLRALIFSSHYDTHKGVVICVRVVDGSYTFKGQALQGTQNNSIHFMATGGENDPIEIGYFSPLEIPAEVLHCGEVGYIATGLKNVKLAKVGDTVTAAVSGIKYHVSGDMTHDTLTPDPIIPLPGYKEPKSMVFLGLFPISADEFQDAREAMEKLQLSDSAFTFKPVSSLALGNGFHCGFLGLLHAEIVQERIFREFGLTMLATAPSVEYRVTFKPGVDYHKLGFTLNSVIANPAQGGEKQSPTGSHSRLSLDRDDKGVTVSIQSATELPDSTYIDTVHEPLMSVSIYSPKRYVGAIMGLATEKRGEYVDLVYVADQAQFTYMIPLSEMIVDFFDRLKSVTEGYASLDYEFFDWAPVTVVKVDILVNKEKVDAFSFLSIESAALARSREIVERLAAVIPRQQFEIPIQAAIGGSVIARADVKAFRKDVTKKLYGGDRTRKDKLLKKQAKGKARMKLIGRVEIPQSAFFAVLKREN